MITPGRLAIIMVLALMLLLPASPQAIGFHEPLPYVFVDCVEYDRDKNELIAHFGYNNPTDDVIEIPQEDNFFFPSSPDRGQPHRFYPGKHHFTAIGFQVSPSLPQITWFLDLNQDGEFDHDLERATAKNDPADYCPEHVPEPVTDHEAVTGPDVPVDPRATADGSATCPQGKVAVAGGFEVTPDDHPAAEPPDLLASYPDGRAWRVTMANGSSRELSFRVHATCMQVE